MKVPLHRRAIQDDYASLIAIPTPLDDDLEEVLVTWQSNWSLIDTFLEIVQLNSKSNSQFIVKRVRLNYMSHEEPLIRNSLSFEFCLHDSTTRASKVKAYLCPC